MSANTRRLRVARSRIRAAITLLREARGLDSMDMETWELVRLDAICLESVAATVTLHIAATNKHLEAMVRSRRK